MDSARDPDGAQLLGEHLWQILPNVERPRLRQMIAGKWALHADRAAVTVRATLRLSCAPNSGSMRRP
jgi:hypothetical protein